MRQGFRDGRIPGGYRQQRRMMYGRNGFEGKLERLNDHWCCKLAKREFTGSVVAVRGGCDDGRLN